MSTVDNGCGTERRPAWRVALLPAVLVAVLAAAGCGGSSGSKSSGSGGSSANSKASSAGVAEAKRRLEAASAQPTWNAPGPAFDAAKAKGKKVLYVGVDASIPVVKTWFDAFREAAGRVGVHVDEFDGKGQVAEWNRGIESGAAGGYDAVLLVSIPPSLVSGAVADAKKKGVAVIDVVNHDPGGQLADGVSADVSFCYSCAGKLIADAVISNSGGKAKGVTFISKEILSGVDERKGISSELASLCPDCEFKEENVAIADWEKRLPNLTRSLLLSNPDTTYIMALYDAMTIPIVPAIAQSGKDVKVASFNATPSVMKSMASGDTIVADVGGANDWLGYGLADQVFRVLSGEKPVADEKIPLRAFTKDNLGSVDLSKPESTWYGQVDFKSEYAKLWGVGGQ